MKYYGILNQNEISSEYDVIKENISIKGFHLYENIIDKDLCLDLIKKSTQLNDYRSSKYGEDFLIKIGEHNVVRLPLIKEIIFLRKLIMTEMMQNILQSLFFESESFFILNQQNIVLNHGAIEHNQSKWHRDFPYLKGRISIPQAFSVLINLNDFTESNGATEILPFSHNLESTPSKEYIKHNKVIIEAPSGSALIINSQIFHRAGINKTGQQRIAINNVFTNPLYRQQIIIPDAIENDSIFSTKLNDNEKLILGFNSRSPISEDEFLVDRNSRLVK